jgi:hypothetical protein
MPSNDRNATPDESTHSKTGRNNSTTESRATGPLAAAARLMSSFRTSRSSETPSEPTDDASPTASLETTRRRFSSTGQRSLSPTAPNSAPSIATSFNPFNRGPSATIHSSSTIPSDLNHASNAETTDPDLPTPETVNVNHNFDAIQNQLRDLAEINCNYFSQQKSDVCRRFENLLLQLLHAIELSIPLVRYITDNFHYFDYSPEVNHRRSSHSTSSACIPSF